MRIYLRKDKRTNNHFNYDMISSFTFKTEGKIVKRVLCWDEATGKYMKQKVILEILSINKEHKLVICDIIKLLSIIETKDMLTTKI